MNIIKTKIIIFSILIFSILSCSNSQKKITPQDEFGYDSDYFIGLRFLQEGKTKQARLKFENCLKKGTYYCSKRSAEKLVQFGTEKEKESACKILLDKYEDEESILYACRFYVENYKYTQIINLTNNIDYKTSNNELCKLRLLALKAQNSNHYMQDVFEWFISRPISSEHFNFYKNHFEKPENEKESTIKQFIITFRIDVYTKDYYLAFNKTKTLFSIFEKEDIEPFEYLVSDIGKAVLYGDDNNIYNAANFTKLAKTYSNFDSSFYLWFYAGRLYSKEQKYYSQSINCFNNALNTANTPQKYDNALWYLLQIKIDQSYKDTIKNLDEYAKKWSDPSYFDDLFDSLIPAIISSKDYKCIITLYEKIKDYASNDTISKISYIYARLIQEGFISEKNENLIKNLFTVSLEKAENPYYKILSTYRLNYSEEQFTNILLKFPIDNSIIVDKNIEKLLNGYIIFGFPELVYDEWDNLFNKGISTETSMKIADFLKSVGRNDSKYHLLSLKICSKASYHTTTNITIDQLKLLYPQNYYDIIENISKKYDLDSSIIYALIRGESFFDAEAKSSVGAIGLTQLMPMTAEDVAANLKISDYSLLDPKTNIEFGIYYLARLISRCDDSILMSFFSYNAGITRVKKWKNAIPIYKDRKEKPPMDLFLEALPYSETREYGRKLISASLYYKWIYDYHDVKQKQKSFYQIIESYFK